MTPAGDSSLQDILSAGNIPLRDILLSRSNNFRNTASLPVQAPSPQPFANPFTSAMSGNQTGTLQPFINQQVQNAQNAQGGGLLNFMPQQYQAGNAGGDVQQPTLPNQLNLAQLLQGLGHRSWMP